LLILVEVFAIEVFAYAVMSNHIHSLLKTRPDIPKQWSDREVARRWRLLFPKRRRKDGKAEEPNEQEILALTASPERIEILRERLSNLSWFNRCLNENIARASNREDKCTGRFWEGRFKSQRADDLAAILACAAYIDLNPIRAGIAVTPESSDFTSIQDRIRTESAKHPGCGAAYQHQVRCRWYR
jgi:REP element-mobilizing transposase RayT